MTNWQWQVIMALVRQVLQLNGVRLFHHSQVAKDNETLKEAIYREKIYRE